MDDTRGYPVPFYGTMRADWWAGKKAEPWHFWYGPEVPTTNEGEPYLLGLRIGVTHEGRPVATGLHLELSGSRALTSDDLRRISLVDLLAFYGRTMPKPERHGIEPSSPTSVVRRPGRRGHPESYYRQVLATHREKQLTEPHRPMSATADALHVSVSQARRLVKKARDLDLDSKDEQ